MSDDRPTPDEVASSDLNFAALVERLVPLVGELFATLASRNPLRMHFADVAGKTLLDIVEVLRQQGISQEAIAASLGLTINGFRGKMKTLRMRYRTENSVASDAPPYIPRTLLERVYGHIDEADSGQRGVAYSALTKHFGGVKADSLKGVLHFLVKSGLMSVSGAGQHRKYRIVNRPAHAPGFVDAMVLLFREGPVTLAHLAQRLGLPEATCAEYIERLGEAGRLEELQAPDGTPRYRVTEYFVPVDSAEGYEAALFDHLSTVIKAVCKKVRAGQHRALADDLNGGATFSFDVADGDPVGDEIAAFLPTMRTRLDSWYARSRTSVDDAPPGTPARRITIYLGQTVEPKDE